MKITIINGPNLNLIGTRETDVYGSESFSDYYEKLVARFNEIELNYFQSNVEGELINKIQEAARLKHQGIVLNAGAYTHTSLAIADAVAAITIPVIEVHISNIFSREDYRHVSYVGAKCAGSIIGMGLLGYELALISLKKLVKV